MSALRSVSFPGTRLLTPALSPVPSGLFDKMTDLRRLALFWNKLSTLPTLKYCTRLEELYLNSNKLQEFPDLGVQCHLRDLNVSRNMIKARPLLHLHPPMMPLPCARSRLCWPLNCNLHKNILLPRAPLL